MHTFDAEEMPMSVPASDATAADHEPAAPAASKRAASRARATRPKPRAKASARKARPRSEPKAPSKGGRPALLSNPQGRTVTCERETWAQVDDLARPLGLAGAAWVRNLIEQTLGRAKRASRRGK